MLSKCLCLASLKLGPGYGVVFVRVLVMASAITWLLFIAPKRQFKGDLLFKRMPQKNNDTYKNNSD